MKKYRPCSGSPGRLGSGQIPRPDPGIRPAGRYRSRLPAFPPGRREPRHHPADAGGRGCRAAGDGAGGTAARQGDLRGAGAGASGDAVAARPQDDNNCYLEIRAGAGGDEAAIFAGICSACTPRYAERQGWRVSIVSCNDGEHGGYKEVIAKVDGEHVYGRLKFESGGHRVQRVPRPNPRAGCTPPPVPWPCCRKCRKPSRWRSTPPS